VSVISCFRATPRRPRGESGPITDRSAFRLCIAAADCQRFLDDSQWPESVIISEWFYIKPTADRRQRPAQPAMNTGVSETERRSLSAVSVPMPPSSSAAVHREVPTVSDVAAGLSLVATTSSSSSSSSLAAAGARATDHTSTSTSDNGDSDATVLYSSNGLSTGDVVV